MYLIDTDVLSATRKFPLQHPVATWLDVNASIVFLSTISIMEIERGIEKQRRTDPIFARDLEAWLQNVLSAFEHLTLPVTADIARRWGRMQYQLGRMDYDLALAATAQEHGLQMLTRNVRHFDKTGIGVVNPFETSP